LTDDPRQRGETYAEIAFHGSMRSGMWRRRPTRELMDEWTTRAISGVEHGSPAYVKALISRAVWGFEEAEAGAAAGTELAKQVGAAAACRRARRRVPGRGGGACRRLGRDRAP